MEKLFLVFCLFAAACTAADVTEVKEDVAVQLRFINFPDGDGVLHPVDLEMKPDLELLDEIAKDAMHNQYYLYTRRNPLVPQTLVFENPDSVLRSNFVANLSTVVIVHGWISNQYTLINPVIRDAYLEKNNVNVIVLDWGRLAHAGYVTATTGVPIVGRCLGKFMAFLNKVTGAPYESMHLIGFSLGGHVVGNAGRELGGKIARITGLDPAGPLWTLNKDRLNPNDAVYVEAMHTNSGYGPGFYGIGLAVGHVDFFPNGGSFQPGCVENVCNHNRAWKLFAATVTHNHLMGSKCHSIVQVRLPVNVCRGGLFPMGTKLLRKIGSGLYRLTTGMRYPY